MSEAEPPVRVVVLNYNGLGRVERCLASLLASDYPALRVTVVDNASADGSPARVARDFPEVELIENGANLGFSRGNNRALRAADEPYLGLLNLDTEVAPGWLRPLVARLAADPLAGGAAPKILHLADRLPLRLTTPAFTPPAPDARTLGVRLYAAATSQGRADVTCGAYGLELDARGRPFRWTEPLAKLAVPVDRGGAAVRLTLAAGAGRPPTPISAAVDGQTIGQAVVTADPAAVTIHADGATIARAARPAVESAGIAPLADGSMRDRGTRLLAGAPWADWDGPAYDQPQEVFAPKGAAVLYRRDMLAALGYLDDGVFMYYEDADLAWRARRRGWRFWYEPASVVRHEHAALSREWSPGFVRNVEFGKLRMLGKNAPGRLVGWHAAAALKFAANDARQALARRDRAAARLVLARLRALADAAAAAPGTWRMRRTEARLARLDGRELRPFLPSRPSFSSPSCLSPSQGEG